MAKFYVGQKVRIVSVFMTGIADRYVGKETVITSLPQPYENIFGYVWMGYGVDLDPLFNPKEESLEPIQYEGMQPAEWSECLWQPEGVAA